MRDVQTGNIEILLSKPISYLYYRALWQIGLVTYSFIIITTIVSMILFFLIGIPSTMTTPYFFPILLLTFILSAILSFLIYITIGLLSFWVEDVNPILWIVDKAIMILGGSYLPIAFFPKIMAQIATYSPFGASQFITRTASIEWQSNWYKLIGIQCFWIILFGILVYFIFKKAIKKVSINGG